MKKLLGIGLAVAASLPLAHAGETEIRRNLEPKLGGARIEAVRETPIPGLFEVQVQAGGEVQILYSDPSGSHVIQTDGREGGHIIDAKSGQDLTEERLRKLNAINFAALPLDQAVKIQRGKGQRVLAMFSDPYCPACRQFEKELAKIDDVTIYVFLYPVIRPANRDHSQAVWCSKDRAQAWLRLAAGPTPKVPEAQPDCPNPIDQTLELGRALGVNSTPTLYLSNGDKYTGGRPAAELRRLLDEARRSRP